MNGELARFAYLRTCTLGTLTIGPLRLATIERPWLPNPAGVGGMSRQSCVPDGVYTVIPHASQHFPDTYAIVNPELGVYYQPGDVPAGQAWGRTAILIHIGNRVQDVIGCIAVGVRHEGERVVDSGIAMALLRILLGRRGNHQLAIRPIEGAREAA